MESSPTAALARGHGIPTRGVGSWIHRRAWEGSCLSWSGWGGSVEEIDDVMGFVSGGWEGEGACNGVGGGRSGRGRLDVGRRLKGEAMTGNGLGGV